MPAPNYAWRCQKCSQINPPHSEACEACSCPAYFTVAQLSEEHSPRSATGSPIPPGSRTTAKPIFSRTVLCGLMLGVGALLDLFAIAFCLELLAERPMGNTSAAWPLLMYPIVTLAILAIAVATWRQGNHGWAAAMTYLPILFVLVILFCIIYSPG